MKDFAENVVYFNEEVLHSIRGHKLLESEFQRAHTLKCLTEELAEYKLAGQKGDYLGAVDAILDLMYFAVGSLHRMGLSPTEMSDCGRIVHTANMQKAKGKVERRAVDGVPDATKPVGWESPEESMRRYLEVDHG